MKFCVNKKRMVRPEGFEPPTLGSEDQCSIQLSYGRIKYLRKFNFLWLALVGILTQKPTGGTPRRRAKKI